MPLYDYACPACGPFTAMRPMAAFRDPYACPACGAAAARTLISAPAVAATHAAPRGEAGGGRVAGTAHPAGCGCCVRRSPVPNAIAAKGGRAFASGGPVRRR